MKKLITFGALICSISVSAQQFEWFDSEFIPSYLQGVFERNGLVYGLLANALDDTNQVDDAFRLERLEFDIVGKGQSGFTIHGRSNWPSGPHYVTRASQYIPQMDAWLLLQTSNISDGHNTFRLLLQDHDFNILESRSIDTLGYPSTFTFACNDTTCHLLGYLIGPPRHELLYARCDFNRSQRLSDIYIGQSHPEPGAWVTGMVMDDAGNLVTFSPGGITVLDTQLTILENYPFASISTYGHGDIQATESYIFTHGLSILPPYNGLRRILLQQYDKAYNIIANDTFGRIESDNYPFIRRSLHIRNNELLVGGHLDGPFNGGNILFRKKEFYVAKYDMELNKIWYKEYGGDRAYWLSGLEVLSDGSIMVYGYVMDTLQQEPQAYLLHLSHNGEILSTSTYTDRQNHHFTISNPGQSPLILHNPDTYQATLKLFTPDGQEVYQSLISDEFHEFHVGHLPQGIYIYIIFQNELPIASGKWIKSQ